MKTIGMIGGMSWESSKVYYEYTNQITKERIGGSHSAKSILHTVNFAEIEKYSFDGNWEEIGNLMAEHAIKLENSGADIILLCTNTIHLVSNHIVESTTVPFLHIADTTGQAIQEKGLKKVALLGTKYTMEKNFYSKILEEKYNLEVIIPEERDRNIIHDIIYKELVRGEFKEPSKHIGIDIIEKLKNKGAEGVILGCTELPILISDSDLSIPSFNTTKIHVEKAIDFALAD